MAEPRVSPLVQPDGNVQEPVIKDEPTVATPNEPVKEPVVAEPKVEPVVAEPKVEPVVAEIPKVEPKKFFENDDWKTEFGEDTPETLKSYKTKSTEYENKIKELEAQEKIEFANDKIKHLNELAKNGIDIDEKTVAFLNKDYNKIDNPLAGLAEHLKDLNPTWSDKKIDFELRKKYRLDDLVPAKDDDGNDLELTDAQKEIEEIAKEDVERDWAEAKNSLIAKQDKIRIIKPKAQADIDLEEKTKAESAKAWDDTVKRISEKNTKIRVEFPDDIQKLMNDAKEKIAPFEFEASKEERELVAQLFKNPQNFWNHFADKDGSLNNDESRAKIHNAMLMIVSGNKAMQKLAETQYKAGREFEIKNDKKINVTPNKANASSNMKGVSPLVQPR